ERPGGSRAAQESDEVAPSHANCPLRTKPTKGQRCASQQNWTADVTGLPPRSVRDSIFAVVRLITSLAARRIRENPLCWDRTCRFSPSSRVSAHVLPPRHPVPNPVPTDLATICVIVWKSWNRRCASSALIFICWDTHAL